MSEAATFADPTTSGSVPYLRHEVAVHPDHLDWERVREELALDVDGLGDDGQDLLLGRLVLQVLEHEAGKVGVQALVAGDELVGEGEAGHEAALLQPEDGGERPGEEDALHARVRDHALGERGGLAAWRNGGKKTGLNSTIILQPTGIGAGQKHGKGVLGVCSEQ